MGRGHMVANHDANRLRDHLGDTDEPGAQLCGSQLPHPLSGDEEMECRLVRRPGGALDGQAEVIDLAPGHAKPQAEILRNGSLPRATVAADEQHAPAGCRVGIHHCSVGAVARRRYGGALRAAD